VKELVRGIRWRMPVAFHEEKIKKKKKKKKPPPPKKGGVGAPLAVGGSSMAFSSTNASRASRRFSEGGLNALRLIQHLS